MKYIILLLNFTLFSSMTVIAQDTSEQSEFQKFLQEQQQGIDEQTKQYDEYEKKQQSEYDAFVRQVEQKWREFQGSTKKEWVDYSDDKDAKSYVNFEEGRVEVEAIAPTSDPKAQQVAEDKLFQKVQQLVSARNPSKENVLADQLVDDRGKAVTEKTVNGFARRLLAKQSIVQAEPITGSDGIKRMHLRVVLRLVPNHLKIRAEKYLSLVRHYAKKFRIDPRHVFAVMHTESYFNPMARSSVPAFGLMQLVPRSGGKDAYRYVYGDSRLIAPEYLYVPKNNIELGVAYLAMLRDQYFKGVNDIQKVTYAITAAYNTGVGNVCKAICGSRNLADGIRIMKQLSSDQLYQTLRTKLPYEETRNYIELVTSRIGSYEEWK